MFVNSVSSLSLFFMFSLPFILIFVEKSAIVELEAGQNCNVLLGF